MTNKPAKSGASSEWFWRALNLSAALPAPTALHPRTPRAPVRLLRPQPRRHPKSQSRKPRRPRNRTTCRSRLNRLRPKASRIQYPASRITFHAPGPKQLSTLNHHLYKMAKTEVILTHNIVGLGGE